MHGFATWCTCGRRRTTGFSRIITTSPAPSFPSIVCHSASHTRAGADKRLRGLLSPSSNEYPLQLLTACWPFTTPCLTWTATRTPACSPFATFSDLQNMVECTRASRVSLAERSASLRFCGTIFWHPMIPTDLVPEQGWRRIVIDIQAVLKRGCRPPRIKEVQSARLSV